jgi:hypothetical protein
MMTSQRRQSHFVLTIATISWLTFTDICVTNDHVYVQFAVITIHDFSCNNYYTTYATSGTRTAYLSGAPEYTPVFYVVRVAKSLVFLKCL